METFWVGIEMHCEQKNSKDMKIYSAWLYPHYNIKHKDKENSSINFPLYFFYFQNFTFCQILHFFNRIFIRKMTK